MKTTFKIVAGIATALLMTSTHAASSPWPDSQKPIQIVVPAPGGGGTGDSIARLLANKMSDLLKAPVIIENRGGANGNIGAGIAATSAADGYRLLFSWAGTLAVNPSLYAKLPFDPVKSFTPIGLVADVPNILVVNKEVPAKTFSAFVDYARQHPDQLNFGSSGNGSSMHMAGELFMRETGTRMVHVPYSAPGQATTNLIANDIQVMFQLIPGIVGQAKAGQVVPLAVMSDKRSPSLPDVPTTAEMGFPAVKSSTWFALLAPAGTDPVIVAKLNQAMNQVLGQSDVVDALTQIGASPIGGTPAQLAEKLNSELTVWRDVIKQSGISMK